MENQNDTTTTETTTVDQSISQLDAAVNAAKARKEKRQAKQSDGETEKPAKAEKPKLTDEEKEQAKAAKDAERAEAKKQRDAAREAKKAAAKESAPPAHMKKVNKAGERLAPLSETAQLLYGDATTNLTSAEIASLAQHLQYFNRVEATKRALERKLEVGDTVQITGGDPRFIGKEGTVVKVQRIRCFVKVAGTDRDVYLFTSDVSPVESEVQESTTESEELQVAVG